jgi:hypothetical protein
VLPWPTADEFSYPRCLVQAYPADLRQAFLGSRDDTFDRANLINTR